MKSLLILKNIKVENANAIAGLTYGFPAITHFLGFTHALSRKLQQKLGVSLGGCAVICHQHQVQAYQPAGWGDYVLALTRNPLTKEGNTQPFNEEGRMHMEVSLIIECNFYANDLVWGEGTEHTIELLEQYFSELIPMHRLAGGSIASIGKVKFWNSDDDATVRAKFIRKTLLKMLPGFLLVDRSYLLREHHAKTQNKELLDSWLDFAALKFSAVPKINEGEQLTEETAADWDYVPKPTSGWLVPITTGYQAISPVYGKGEVARARDSNTPFCFVESVYGVGEWLSPHRVKTLDDVIWRYHQKDDWYLCVNKSSPVIS